MNKISALAIVIIALMIIAEIVVLSVFNGFTDQLKSIHQSFDSDLQLSPTKGKVFMLPDSTFQNIQNVEGVQYVTRILEDDAILNFRGRQDVVRFKGVDSNFFMQNKIKEHIYIGDTNIFVDFPSAVIGIGIEYNFGLNIRSNNFCNVMYPNRKMKHLKKSTGSYKSINFEPKGVFQIEMEYDEKYMIIPIGHARTLTGYSNEITTLEIKVHADYNVQNVRKKINEIIPEYTKTEDREERHASIYKAIQVEKIMTYLIFVLILFIASLNLYAAVSMLVLSKKKDVITLDTLGLSRQKIRLIFFIEGLLIISTGIIIGGLLAYLLVWLQGTVGIVRIPEPNALVEYVPVRLRASDFFISICLTFLVSIIMILKPIFSSAKQLK